MNFCGFRLSAGQASRRLLYLNPPLSGGLCEGVITIPSASPEDRWRLYARIACDSAGVGASGHQFGDSDENEHCDHRSGHRAG